MDKKMMVMKVMIVMMVVMTLMRVQMTQMSGGYTKHSHCAASFPFAFLSVIRLSSVSILPSRAKYL